MLDQGFLAKRDGWLFGICRIEPSKLIRLPVSSCARSAGEPST